MRNGDPVRVIVAVALAAIAVGCDETEAPSSTTYEFDANHYEPDGAPLRIANETLVFTLGPRDSVQIVSREAPGDLLLDYTRLGCFASDDVALGSIQNLDLDLEGVVPARVERVSVELVPDEINFDTTTCFAYLTADGAWHGLVDPTATTAGSTFSSEVALGAENAVAVAIFLPTYTTVSRVSYSLEP